MTGRYLNNVLALVGISLWLGGCSMPGADDSGTDAGGNTSHKGKFSLTVKEVNIGDETHSYEATTDSPATNFGAIVENGRLTLNVNTGGMNLEAAVNTSPSNTLPGTFATDSGFTDGAWVEYTLDSNFWDMQGSGQMQLDSCPELGDMVKATLTDVRLASSISQSIKLINGTLQVEVVEDDASLECE